MSFFDKPAGRHDFAVEPAVFAGKVVSSSRVRVVAIVILFFIALFLIIDPAVGLAAPVGHRPPVFVDPARSCERVVEEACGRLPVAQTARSVLSAEMAGDLGRGRLGVLRALGVLGALGVLRALRDQKKRPVGLLAAARNREIAALDSARGQNPLLLEEPAVEEPPFQKAPDDGVELLARQAAVLKEHLVAHGLGPFQPVAVAVDGHQQLEGYNPADVAMLPGDTDDLLVAEEISVEREIIESVFRGSCHEVEVVVVDFSAKLPHGAPFEAGLRIIFRVRALEGKLLGQVLRHKNQASKKNFISPASSSATLRAQPLMMKHRTETVFFDLFFFPLLYFAGLLPTETRLLPSITRQ